MSTNPHPGAKLWSGLSRRELAELNDQLDAVQMLREAREARIDKLTDAELYGIDADALELEQFKTARGD